MSVRKKKVLITIAGILMAFLLAPFSIELDYLSDTYLMWPLIIFVLIIYQYEQKLYPVLLAISTMFIVLRLENKLSSVAIISAIIMSFWLLLLAEIINRSKNIYVFQIIFICVLALFYCVWNKRMPLYLFDSKSLYVMVSESRMCMVLYSLCMNQIMLLLCTSALLELPIVRKILGLRKLKYDQNNTKIFVGILFLGGIFLFVDEIIDNIFLNMYGMHTSLIRITSGEKIKLCMYVSIIAIIMKIVLVTKRRHFLDLSVIEERETKIINMMSDIKDLNRELEYHIGVRTTQLEEAYSDVESFSYTISHELKTPIHEIETYVEFIEEDNKEKLNEQSKKDIESVKKICNRTVILIQQMMEYSKIGYRLISYDIIDMNKLIDECISEIVIDKSKVDITVNEIVDCESDTFLIKRMFLNVISNAVKFSRTRELPQIVIFSFQDEQWNTYSVQDNGVGFDMKYAKNIFGIFERFHNESEFEGSGIGLATVKKIVDKLGGEISLKTEINKGCQVTIRIPKIKM